MCVAFLFLKARGDASRAPAVVLCVNRDEAFGRPTLPSHWWEDAPDVFAGRDLEAMGTWCGVSRTGRVAVLTNYTEPTDENTAGNTAYRPSRGALAADFLKGSPSRDDGDDDAPHLQTLPPSPTTYAAFVAKTRDAYAGFNLIVGDCVTGEFAYVGNPAASNFPGVARGCALNHCITSLNHIPCVSNQCECPIAFFNQTVVSYPLNTAVSTYTGTTSPPLYH